MKIVIITEYFPRTQNAEITGGVESRAFNIAKELAKKHEVVVLTSWRRGEPRKQKINDVSVIRCGNQHAYSNVGNIISRFAFSVAAFKEAIKLKDVDIIDGNNFITYLPANFAAKKLKAPCVATYHETWIGEWIKNQGLIIGALGGIWERIALSLKWNKIIAVSNFTKKRLIEKGVDPKKISVVYNGVDQRIYEKYEIDKEKVPKICYIGRLTERKRIVDLIYAVKIVKKELSPIKCVIAGEGPEKNHLQRLVWDLKLEKNISFIGFVNEPSKIKVLKSSHIFCTPSTLEGFGIALLEAIACGTPYVCSDIPVFKEITEDGKGGLLFKQKNYKDLAKKILLLLKDKPLYDKKVEEEKEIIKKYNWKKIALDLAMEYKNIIKKNE